MSVVVALFYSGIREKCYVEGGMEDDLLILPKSSVQPAEAVIASSVGGDHLAPSLGEHNKITAGGCGNSNCEGKTDGKCRQIFFDSYEKKEGTKQGDGDDSRAEEEQWE